MRVALSGGQVVFASLLTVPFTQRFESLSRYEKNLYFGTLLCTALTTALFVAPSANHRMLFRKRDKDYIVLVAIRHRRSGGSDLWCSDRLLPGCGSCARSAGANG